ncbi:MAG: hypothetical protein ACRENG_17900 [bacterium]
MIFSATLDYARRVTSAGRLLSPIDAENTEFRRVFQGRPGFQSV